MDVVFSDAPVAPLRREPPVVVVGLPRSGSKYLTHVLNGLEGLYVFDDLYYFREARGIDGATGPLSAETFDHLIRWIAVRSVFPDRKYNFNHRPVSEAQVEQLKEGVTAACRGRDVAAHDLLEEWMVRFALLQGCHRWGYKAPQEFMYLDFVANAFPGTQFVFLYRDPRRVMSSYKYVPDRHGAAGRYHPVTYALYWRLAQRTVAEKGQSLLVHRVKFEDLVDAPDKVGAGLGAFLDLPWRGAEIPKKVNSSFTNQSRQEITPTERWLCERMAGSEMVQLGYAPDTPSPRLRDVPDLLRTTLRSALHQLHQLCTNPVSRKSAFTFLGRLAGRSSR